MTAAGLPVLVDVALGVRPTAVTGAGIVVAVVAVVAVALVGAREPAPGPETGRATGPTTAAVPGSGLGWGLGAGAAHAAMYVFLGRAPVGAGVWPVTAAFAVTGLLALLVLGVQHARRRLRLRVPWSEVPAVLAVGVLAAGGTVGFLYAAAGGSVGVAAVTTELSPVATALLARLVLTEPLPPPRVAGLVLAVAAATLVGLG